MAKRRLDPDSLAERLDTVLPPGQFDVPARDEDQLVDVAVRVAASPQPEPIMPAAKARMRSQVLSSYRQQIQDTPAPSQPLYTTWWIVIGGVVLVALIVGLTLIRLSRNAVALPPEVTEEPALIETLTSVPPTPTSVEATPTPSESTPAPVEATPDVAPTTDDSLPTVIVIEGPVEAIEGNIITAFGIDIEVAPDDSILAAIQPGDHIRVEGNIMDREETTIIIAESVTVIDVDFVTGAPPVLPPGCKITGMGRLKCSER